MSDDKSSKRRASSPKTADYDVGYGKPPTEGRFEPGRSGNPNGRPRGAKNKTPGFGEERLKSIVLAEAYRTVKVNDGNKKVTLPLAQAVIRSIAVNAARGQPRAQQIFTKILGETERSQSELENKLLDTVLNYKNRIQNDIDECEELGLPEPEYIPHPEDIILDLRTGTVEIHGPLNKAEKAEWDEMHERVKGFDEQICEITALLGDKKYRRYIGMLESDLAYAQRVRKLIVDTYGEPRRKVNKAKREKECPSPT